MVPKDVGQGTGLGLSQVFGFAKQSGGEVIAKNVDAGGASFTLYMPLAERSADQLIPEGGSEVATSGSGVSILVVEDNLEVGEFATQVLAELGYSTR